MTYTIDPIPLWTPNPATVGQTRMAQLIAAKGKANYAELWQWSVDEPEAFWSELWDFCGAVGEKGTKIVVDRSRMPGARWFPDAKLNYAENLRDRRIGIRQEHPRARSAVPFALPAALSQEAEDQRL